MCASASRLHRVWVDGTAVIHESTKDRGSSWQKQPLFGIPGAVAAADTVPTIHCDRMNRIWVWFHNDDGAQVFRAEATAPEFWTPGSSFGIASRPGLKWPRFADAPLLTGGVMGIAWDAALEVLQAFSMEAFAIGTQHPILGIAHEFPGIPEQLVEFDSDRRSRQHLVYTAGPNTYHLTHDMGHWSSPVTVATDERTFSVATFATAANRGLYSFWNGDLLGSQLTVNNMVTVSEGPGEPTTPIFRPPGVGALTQHHVGICHDHWDWYWLCAQQDASTIITWYSRDAGRSWQSV